LRSGKTLGIIPARGGSKGLPRKNILPLCGRPLVAWTIEQGAASKRLTRCIVSSDSEEIIRVAKEWGGDVPFVRPAEYARDDSPTAEAIVHALDYLKERGETYDFVAELEPTSPLRKPGDIDDAIATFLAAQCDSLVTVGEVHMEHPAIVKRIEGDFLKPYVPGTTLAYQRQQLDGAYFPYGVLYIATVEYYRRARSFYGERTAFHLIERWQNFEVDDGDDLTVCEALMQKHVLAKTRGA
jgi:CMP-N-acetylneuraminic acid synthetase